jgi:protein SCO1/2
MFSSRFLAVTTALLSGVVACNAQTSTPLRSLTEDMGITQKLGDTVATDAVFKTETGETTKLGELFEDRPVVLFPIYYSCPSGCPKLFENVMKTVGLLNPNGRYG